MTISYDQVNARLGHISPRLRPPFFRRNFLAGSVKSPLPVAVNVEGITFVCGRGGNPRTIRVNLLPAITGKIIAWTLAGQQPENRRLMVKQDRLVLSAMGRSEASFTY
jgi:hypothetical protein